MRAQLRGIEAVLADGTVVSHLAGLVKDNTGYDYPSLLAGSEGTLAVVTQARLRLVPRLRDTVTALVGVGGLDELRTGNGTRRQPGSSASRSSSTSRYPRRSGCGSPRRRRAWWPTWTRGPGSLPSGTWPTGTCT